MGKKIVLFMYKQGRGGERYNQQTNKQTNKQKVQQEEQEKATNFNE